MKVIATYFQSLIVISAMTLTFLFKYMTKFQSNDTNKGD